MGCSFIASIQSAIGDVVDVAAPIVAAIPGPWQIPAMVVLAVNTVENGGDLTDVVKAVGMSYLAGEIGGAVGAAGDSAAAAATYGTELGSAQSAMLAAQEAGLGTIGDIAGNIAGGVARSTVLGGDPMTALVTGGIGAGVGELTAQIPGFSGMPAAAQNAIKGAMAAELQGKDPSQALMSGALATGMNIAKDYAPPASSNLPTMPYNYNPATNPADPNADSNPDLNGTVADNIPAGNLPTTDYNFVGDYGLSTGINPTSGLTPPTVAGNTNPDGSTNYALAAPTISEGLTQPIAPTLSSMNGGYGLITPVAGGYMTSLGFVPEGSSSVLGDPASFINDPNVLGNTVIGTDTLRAPLTGVTNSSSAKGSFGSLGSLGIGGAGATRSGGTTGGLPTVVDPAALAGGYKTVGTSGYDDPDAKLEQIYSGLTAVPEMKYDAPIYAAALQQNMAPLQTMYQPQTSYYPPNQFFADGGAVQRFADGDRVADSTSTAQQDQLAYGLKALSALDSGLKMPQHNLRQIQQMGGQYSPKVMPQLAALLRSRGMTLADGGQPDDHQHPNYDGTPVFRTGGLEGLGGKYVEGKGDGTSDDISAMLANGEYVFSADVVSALGNGSNKAGADKLGEMVEAIRARARSAPPDKLPPDAKSPLEYLKSPKGKKNG